MNRRLSSALVGLLSLFCTTLLAVGQTPAPPVPQLTAEQKAAAAAIEAPKSVVPPPAPGQLQSAVPAKPAAPASPPTSPEAPAIPAAPAVPSQNSASKMQVLEAVTQKPDVKVAPRVASPSEKIPITSSTSTSRQFIVHGKVFETRSAMSTRCEEIAQDLRKVLNDKEPWVLPIVVVLNVGEDAAKSKAPPISTTISELTFGGFHLQVTVNEGPGLTEADLRREVVRALLAERILRNHQKIETPKGRLLLPDWIMTGVLHGMDYRSSTSPSAVFAKLFRSGKIYGIEEIIEASPVEMDGLSRTIYETSCCALVLALVDQPSGPQNLNKFLNSLASDPRSERELLSAAFPNFAASASSLNKWWSLQLATLAKPGIAEPLTPAESIKAIEDAITIHYEALPAAVPKNVKMHPFVLPAPLPVAAANEAPAPSSPAAAPGKTKAKDEAKDGPPGEEEKPKRSLFRRLFFLGDASEKDDKSKPVEKPAETSTAAEKEKKAEEEKKPGFMGRLFGAGTAEPVTKDSKPKPADKPAETTTATAEKDKKAEEEKKPGFMGRLFGAGTAEPVTKDSKPKPADKPAETATATAEKEKKVEGEKTVGLMDRFFGASSEEKKTPAEPATKDSKPKPADKPAETATAAAEKEKKAEEEKKPGFMGRLFGAGSEEKKPAEKPNAKESKPKATDKPAVIAAADKDKKASEKEKEKAAAIEKPKVTVKKEPEAKTETQEEKKPTKLNPMNWFRGDKKPAEEKPADKPAKEKQAFLTPPATMDVARLISPMLADAWQLLAPAPARQTTEPLFDFRKRKPKAEEEEKVEPKSEEPAKKSASKPEAEDRPAVKKSAKPHVTNPNSKPASKSSTSSADKSRTTNPNAKPATPEQIKSTAAGAAAAESALVQVDLPLEEYQHILNHPDKSKILSFNIASLRALELRVSVLFRPVIKGYLVAVLDIEAGKTKDMEKRLATLHEFALIAYQKSIAVRDYLDWFEASESGRLSGKFDSYLNLPKTIQKELPPRTDPISKYLDAIDKEFSK